MPAVVRSVNAGTAGPVPGLKRPSGIHKRPVDVIEVRDPGPKRGGLGSGVVGDAIISRQHHGGTTQAVYAVAREELDWWGEHLGRDLPDGMFGENLTTAGLEVDTAEVGERWQVGGTLLEVCGPRIPCATFAKHMAERAWVRRFAERGLHRRLPRRASSPGRSGRATRSRSSHRPGHGLTLPMYFRALDGRQGPRRDLPGLGAAAAGRARLARRGASERGNDGGRGPIGSAATGRGVARGCRSPQPSAATAAS